jgi:hypothetical protein
MPAPASAPSYLPVQPPGGGGAPLPFAGNLPAPPSAPAGMGPPPSGMPAGSEAFFGNRPDLAYALGQGRGAPVGGGNPLPFAGNLPSPPPYPGGGAVSGAGAFNPNWQPPRGAFNAAARPDLAYALRQMQPPTGGPAPLPFGGGTLPVVPGAALARVNAPMSGPVGANRLAQILRRKYPGAQRA